MFVSVCFTDNEEVGCFSLCNMELDFSRPGHYSWRSVRHYSVGLDGSIDEIHPNDITAVLLRFFRASSNPEIYFPIEAADLATMSTLQEILSPSERKLLISYNYRFNDMDNFSAINCPHVPCSQATVIRAQKMRLRPSIRREIEFKFTAHRFLILAVVACPMTECIEEYAAIDQNGELVTGMANSPLNTYSRPASAIRAKIRALTLHYPWVGCIIKTDLELRLIRNTLDTIGRQPHIVHRIQAVEVGDLPTCLHFTHHFRGCPIQYLLAWRRQPGEEFDADRNFKHLFNISDRLP